MSRRGRASLGGDAASMLAASTSARITMPGPPPAGVSSTCRVLLEPVLADVAHLERPQARRQRLAGQRMPERPGEHLGIEGEDGGGEGHMIPPV
jgi:hypothetical protein